MCSPPGTRATYVPACPRRGHNSHNGLSVHFPRFMFGNVVAGAAAKQYLVFRFVTGRGFARHGQRPRVEYG
eukprot:5828767-Lingulodinium_polyedra.AAC.1